jgi:putative SOS response-associated peptidase YedK
MCGRVRLSSDYSEIKIRLKFAPNSIAPNFELDWNKPPTAPMLVAIRSVDGERIPKMMKWGLIPHWAKDDKLQYSTLHPHENPPIRRYLHDAGKSLFV